MHSYYFSDSALHFDNYLVMTLQCLYTSSEYVMRHGKIGLMCTQNLTTYLDFNLNNFINKASNLIKFINKASNLIKFITFMYVAFHMESNAAY